MKLKMTINNIFSIRSKIKDAFLTECGSWQEHTFSTERYIPDGMWRSIVHQHVTICHTQTHCTFISSHITQSTYEKIQPENTLIRYKILLSGIPSRMRRPVEKEMHTCQAGILPRMRCPVEKEMHTCQTGILPRMRCPVEKEMHTCQTSIPSGMHRSVEKNRKPKPCIPSGMHPVNNRKMI